tara:strand:- start:240 stop:1094 length:855 start_codon:yes stop_codon:yes gene_type:complete
MNFEKLILQNDSRGISELSKYLHPSFCLNAAKLVLDNIEKVFITTGFYIKNSAAIETDGPLGAISIGNALENIGYEVVYITDQYIDKYIRQLSSKNSRQILFPIMNIEDSKIFSKNLITKESPTLLIGIERPGAHTDNKYRNMRDVEFTQYVARIDTLFDYKIKSIGIGDGGNEIGMGNLFQQVLDSKNLVNFPAMSQVSELIISSVSNWGGYGLVGALSQIQQTNLLPSISTSETQLKELVELGAVDGISGIQEYSVDGFDIKTNSKILEQITLEASRTENFS